MFNDTNYMPGPQESPTFQSPVSQPFPRKVFYNGPSDHNPHYSNKHEFSFFNSDQEFPCLFDPFDFGPSSSPISSPNWGTEPLFHDRPSSPYIKKPQPPPRLLMPDTGGNPSSNFTPPMINVPEGDGFGPELHIVPAMPVTGGCTVSTATPFQTLEALQGESSRP
jgi:hypothetical protein